MNRTTDIKPLGMTKQAHQAFHFWITLFLTMGIKLGFVNACSFFQGFVRLLELKRLLRNEADQFYLCIPIKQIFLIKERRRVE
jgi:hypothetical protein